ncbi:phage holin family protein [Actinomyces mediterranea]|uniref:phage holin family protein n=1 Tax=Actinomyces mediterranea TaxID=1871028 RepID=UPI000970AED1|nr:phage holin family protein [Actinomyces mediterranea]
MEFVLRLAATMAGIWVSTRLVPSISFDEGTSLSTTLISLAVIALVFTVINSIIKPIVKTLAFPLYILTFGLFALITNSLMFALTGWLSTQLGFPFHTGGFVSCVLGALITAVVSSIVYGLVGSDSKN